jgi:hypothetical protein
MATEKRLIPDGKKVTLDDLPPGTIFAFGDDCVAVKSEYRCSNGLIEAFIIDSGEQFWGGAKTAKEQNELMVQPLAIVEVKHGRWEQVQRWATKAKYRCSVCGREIMSAVKVNTEKYPYCHCGAKMAGDGNET